MAAPVYDDEDTQKKLAESEELAAQRQQEVAELNDKLNNSGRLDSPTGRLADREAVTNRDTSSQTESTDDTLNKGYTGPGTPRKKRRNLVGDFIKNHGKGTFAALIAGVITGTVSIGGFFGFLNVFSLDNFLSGVEDKAFVRYQVNMEGRSSKWINAYLTLRIADIDNADGTPVSSSKWKDEDNLFFRSNRVDNNNPVYDWYRTMRTSSFEQDVFEKHGISFTSVAIKDGTSTRFRPAKITINQETPLVGDIDENDIKTMESIASGNGSQSDIERLNKKFGTFIETDVMGSDKSARKAIKAAVDTEIPAWQWMKRRHIRKDIQNMTGVRSWRFFENTRNTADEKLIDMKNKFLLAALPDDIKAGRFMLCLFGVSECSSSADPVSDNKASIDSSTAKDGGASYPDAEDGTAGAKVDTGEAGDAAQKAVTEGAEEVAEKLGTEGSALLTRKIMVQLASKINGAAGIASIIDSLSRIDKLIATGGLTAMVVAAKTQQTIGFYTTLGIARDQMRTGELTSTEYDNFMTMVDGIGNNQIWSEIDNPGSTNDLSSSSQCTDEALAQLEGGTYTPLCEQYRIGGLSNAEKIEQWWNSGLGGVLSPVFEVWRNSLGIVVSAANDFIDGIVSALGIDKAFSAILSATGLQSTVEGAISWVTGQAAKGLGAGPMVEDPTGPQIGLLAAEGAAATSESSMRYQGAAASTELTRAENTLLVARYADNELESQGIYERYISLNNADSFASRQLFRFANSTTFDSIGNTVSSIFSVIGNLPSLFTLRVGAADLSGSAYQIADMAGLQTYDFPSQCTEADIFTATPASSTNADELGYIPAEELTWDLVNNKDLFWARLYENDLTSAQAGEVYDCAILETSVRGSNGAKYGYEDDNSIYATPTSSTTTASTPASTGTGQLDDKAYLQSNSVGVACDPRTDDLGEHTGYANKSPVPIRLCALPDVTSGDAESTVGSSYYITGANGHAIVNSKISTNVMNMIVAMKSTPSITSISATSSFRSHARQTSLYNAYLAGTGNKASVPGTSNHEMGLAIDFRIAPAGQQNSGYCKYVSGVCTAKADPYGVYTWLIGNAKNYGFSQYSGEFWHWEAIGVGGN